MNFGLTYQRVSWIILILSIVAFFMLRVDLLYGIIWIGIIMFIDAANHFFFIKKKLSKIEGLTIQVSDRLSEFLLFYPNAIWILLTTLNVYFTIASLKDKKIFALPLRPIFLFFLILKYFNLIPPSLIFLV